MYYYAFAETSMNSVLVWKNRQKSVSIFKTLFFNSSPVTVVESSGTSRGRYMQLYYIF